jgi:hypothetical protein
MESPIEVVPASVLATSVVPKTRTTRSRLRSQFTVGLLTALTGACSEVVSATVDAGRDAAVVDVAVVADRQFATEELNCRGSVCPEGYICVDRCENGVCGPNHYRCRPLPSGCPDPPRCTSTTEPCACPACLSALCPPACTYQNTDRNVVDCNH